MRLFHSSAGQLPMDCCDTDPTLPKSLPRPYNFLNLHTRELDPQAESPNTKPLPSWKRPEAKPLYLCDLEQVTQCL